MSTRLSACLVAAAAILVPHSALSADAARDALRLPPIPYAETIPWLAGAAQQKTQPYLGLLLAPVPFTATPVFAAAPIAERALFATHRSADSKIE